MDKNDYVKKMQQIINKGIENGVYEKTEDNALQNLKRFQDFLYRNFSKYGKDNDILPSINQSAVIRSSEDSNIWWC